MSVLLADYKPGRLAAMVFGVDDIVADTLDRDPASRPTAGVIIPCMNRARLLKLRANQKALPEQKAQRRSDVIRAGIHPTTGETGNENNELFNSYSGYSAFHGRLQINFDV